VERWDLNDGGYNFPSVFAYQKNAGSLTDQALDREGIGFALSPRNMVPVLRIVKAAGRSGREEWMATMLLGPRNKSSHAIILTHLIWMSERIRI